MITEDERVMVACTECDAMLYEDEAMKSGWCLTIEGINRQWHCRDHWPAHQEA